MRAKSEAHESKLEYEVIIIDAMTMLIEKVLNDGETRERLLDHSVLNDFFFEEKLKEKRM